MKFYKYVVDRKKIIIVNLLCVSLLACYFQWIDIVLYYNSISTQMFYEVIAEKLYKIVVIIKPCIII